MRTTLIPTEMTSNTVDAIERGRGLHDGDPIILLHVLPRLSPADPVSVWKGPDDEERVARAREHMILWAREKGLENVRLHAAIGSPVRCIVDEAETRRADLIVMTTRVDGDDPFPLGSVTAGVLRRAPCSVWVERRVGPEASERWLVAVDLSDGELPRVKAYLSRAVREAQLAGVVLDLVHVYPPGVEVAYPEHEIFHQRRAKEMLERHAKLEELRLALPDDCRGNRYVIEGDVVSSLRRLAARYEAVVIGTHGRRGLDRLWMGSVAERMAMAAPHCVLVIRP